MPLAPHQRELLDLCPDLDPADVPQTWSGSADLDEQIYRTKQKRLARLKAEEAARTAPPPLITKSMRTSARLPAQLADAIGKALATFVEARVGPLLERIAALESEKMTFAGVWKRGQAYTKGAFATHGGSAWHANVDTTAEPGTSPDWVLAIKRGRDGKDAKPSGGEIRALAR